ncbi:FliG C-terminal domain-containing protein [Cognatiyoonia sp. IB215182]|uniref:FliG C-terminal domain-containing protein n=1 Tax=Cognatiyoonia sp. IB215182 TaxID=3097353 RepID=UPI002A1324BA|nr:FliG C-terminal domain-containing protein [Cognatiyoonia sp. IB215182]MDX8352255.1 FliG C-terminal domain-containing protein [Cognatiyoonia sp. IB215182]
MNVQAPIAAQAQLTRRRKAAMIVQMIVGDGSQLSLSQLPVHLQELLTQELGALRLVDRDTVAAVAEEFLGEVEAIGLTAPGTKDGAILALADHLSPELADRLRKQTADVRNGDHWPIITALPVDRLVTIMMAESIEVSAITLSKLTVAKAAEVLTQTPGERARRISLAMSRTEHTSSEAVRTIGAALADEYGQITIGAFEKAPVQRLGDILNATRADRRDDVLEGLNNDDPEFAGHVRKAIFTFKDIANRIKPVDIPNCIREVPAEVLGRAMAGALAGEEDVRAAAEFILANVSQRIAAQMRDDAEEAGTVKKADAEAAMSEVTTAIRGLADAGKIVFRDPDAADEDG